MIHPAIHASFRFRCFTRQTLIFFFEFHEGDYVLAGIYREIEADSCGSKCLGGSFSYQGFTMKLLRYLSVGMYLGCVLSETFAEGPIVDGYAFPLVGTQGESITFHLSSAEPMQDVSIPIYDPNGNQVHSLVTDLWPQEISNTDPWKNGYGFDATKHYTIPDDMKSGVYYLGTPMDAHATLLPSPEVPFIVKERSRMSDVVMVVPNATGNAYNESGGHSIYTAEEIPRVVSLERPQSADARSRAFAKWVTDKDFNHRFVSDFDLENFDEISGSKLLVVYGHSEYWTKQGRENFDRFVEEGGNALVISGNTMYREIEYDDPQNPSSFEVLTISRNTWSDDHLVLDSIGANYEWGGRIGIRDYAFTIADDTAPYLEGVDLNRGDKLRIPTAEYDGIPLDGFDEEGYPLINEEYLAGFHDYRLVGFDSFTFGNRARNGAWFEFQRTPDSGRVIVAGSSDWAHYGMYSVDHQLVKQITENMIDYLVEDADRFAGDYNRDSQIDVHDLDRLSEQINSEIPNLRFDLNDDEIVDQADHDFWIDQIGQLRLGDANQDGLFTSSDLRMVFAAGKYESELRATWSEGDWDGNLRFDSGDLVKLYQSRSADCLFDDDCRAFAVAVPENNTNMMMLAGLLLLPLWRRKS